MTWLTLFTLASIKACCSHQDQADCNFSCFFPTGGYSAAATSHRNKENGQLHTEDKVSKPKTSLIPQRTKPPVQTQLNTTIQGKSQRYSEDSASKQHPCPVRCTRGSWPAPQHSCFGAGVLPVALRGCKHTGFPTHHEKHLLFPELVNWLFSGYMSLKDLNFLGLKVLL